jgi:hypothetical protein
LAQAALEYQTYLPQMVSIQLFTQLLQQAVVEAKHSLMELLAVAALAHIEQIQLVLEQLIKVAQALKV